MKFCIRVRLKPSNDRGEFDLDRAKRKNNIAENSVALGHETHNSQFVSTEHNDLLGQKKNPDNL